MRLKLFVVAIAACRPAKVFGAEGTGYSFHCGLTVNFTAEEAEAWGVEAAKKEWPEAEGFYCHKASVQEMLIEDARRLLRMIDMGEFDDEYASDEIGPPAISELPVM